MRRQSNSNCALCRVMRSMAFSGAGALVGAVGAMLFDATRQNILLSAVVMAAIFVFAFVETKKNRDHR